MKTRINYTKPSITKIERDLVQDAMENSWGPQFMYYLDKFESMFAEWLGVKYAMTTSSCTGALHIGLSALGIGPGDEVILPDTTWIATAAAVAYLGAKPVFVDILPDTWCIDPKKVYEAITEKTKAIIAVHLYGDIADISELKYIGGCYGIPIIEDAAEGVGSEFREGVRVGSSGNFGVFSFHGSKTITTGEGGMFVTNDKELYEKALLLSNHGRTGGGFHFSEVGYKYKMTPIQAAIGCGQMQRIDELLDRKREIFEFYKKYLNDPVIVSQMNIEPPGTKNGYWMPTCVFNKPIRDKLIEALKAENIDGRIFFDPLSSMPMFESKPENFNAYDIPPRAINLPSYHDMTTADQERVIVTILRGCGL
jgi:perosamine synthetase